METQYCNHCGNEIAKEAEICPKCGVRVKKLRVRSPTLAAILSFLWPGLGQFYNGQVAKGLFLFIGILFALILCFILIGIPITLLMWIYAIVDAYQGAT